MLLVGAYPLQIIIKVREPGRVVTGGRQSLEQPISAGEDDIHSGRYVATGRGDQFIIAGQVYVRSVDAGVTSRPGFVNRVSLRGPIVKVPRLLRTLTLLNELCFHRICLLGALNFEGVPPLLVEAVVLAVDLGRARRSLQISA